MSTANKLCDRALRLIGATSPIKPAAGETYQQCFEVLLSILNEYESQSVDMGLTIPTVIGNDLEEPADVTTSLEFILAANVAPYLQKPVTVNIKKKVRAARQYIRSEYGPKPEKCFPDTMPIGSGNKGYPITSPFYADEE